MEPGAWETGCPDGWDALMKHQVERTRGYFAGASSKLPAAERKKMVAAEIMREVYSELLDLMVADGFRVWETDYRLTKARKLWLASSVFLRSFLSV